MTPTPLLSLLPSESSSSSSSISNTSSSVTGTRGAYRGDPTCVGRGDWSTPTIDYRDCLDVLRNLERTSVRTWGYQTLEFLAQHAESVHRDLRQWNTPTIITSSKSIYFYIHQPAAKKAQDMLILGFFSSLESCMLAVVLVSDFPPWHLPYGEPGRNLPTDVEDWEAIQRAGQSLVTECVFSHDTGGWVRKGM